MKRTLTHFSSGEEHQADSLIDNKVDNRNEIKKKSPSIKNQLLKGLENVFWLSASALTAYYTNIINILMIGDSRINFTACVMGLIFTGLISVIFLYLIFWCSWIKGIHSDNWETYSPYSIPIATFCGVSSSFCWFIAFYGVYGYKTPIILFILLMGFVTSVSLLPPFSSEESSKMSKVQKNE